jgi:hypothetical protein
MGTESVESGQQLSAQQADSQTWSAVQGALVQVGSLAAGVLVTVATGGVGGVVLGAGATFLANQAGAALQNADTAANGGQVTSNSQVSLFAAATNNFGFGGVTHQELTQSLANAEEQGISAVGMAAGMYAGGIVGSLFEDGESLVGSVGADAAEDLSSSGAAAPGAAQGTSEAAAQEAGERTAEGVAETTPQGTPGAEPQPASGSSAQGAEPPSAQSAPEPTSQPGSESRSQPGGKSPPLRARLASSVASSVTNQSFLAGSNYGSQLIGIQYEKSIGAISSAQASQQKSQAGADLVLNLAVSPALGVADMAVPQFESGAATAAGHLVSTGVPNLGLTWGSDLLNHQRLSLADAVQMAATSLTMTGIAMGTSSALGSANGSENSAYDDQGESDTSQKYDADQNASNNSGQHAGGVDNADAANNPDETSTRVAADRQEDTGAQATRAPAAEAPPPPVRSADAGNVQSSQGNRRVFIDELRIPDSRTGSETVVRDVQDLRSRHLRGTAVNPSQIAVGPSQVSIAGAKDGGPTLQLVQDPNTGEWNLLPIIGGSAGTAPGSGGPAAPTPRPSSAVSPQIGLTTEQLEAMNRGLATRPATGSAGSSQPATTIASQFSLEQMAEMNRIFWAATGGAGSSQPATPVISAVPPGLLQRQVDKLLGRAWPRVPAAPRAPLLRVGEVTADLAKLNGAERPSALGWKLPTRASRKTGFDPTYFRYSADVGDQITGYLKTLPPSDRTAAVQDLTNLRQSDHDKMQTLLTGMGSWLDPSAHANGRLAVQIASLPSQAREQALRGVPGNDVMRTLRNPPAYNADPVLQANRAVYLLALSDTARTQAMSHLDSLEQQESAHQSNSNWSNRAKTKRETRVNALIKLGVDNHVPPSVARFVRSAPAFSPEAVTREMPLSGGQEFSVLSDHDTAAAHFVQVIKEAAAGSTKVLHVTIETGAQALDTTDGTLKPSAYAGPVGSALFIREVRAGMKVVYGDKLQLKVAVVTDSESQPVFTALAKQYKIDDIVTMHDAPASGTGSAQTAEDLLTRLDPKALLSFGQSGLQSNSTSVIEAAGQRGIPTFAVSDGTDAAGVDNLNHADEAMFGDNDRSTKLFAALTLHKLGADQGRTRLLRRTTDAHLDNLVSRPTTVRKGYEIARNNGAIFDDSRFIPNAPTNSMTLEARTGMAYRDLLALAARGDSSEDPAREPTWEEMFTGRYLSAYNADHLTTSDDALAQVQKYNALFEAARRPKFDDGGMTKLHYFLDQVSMAPAREKARIYGTAAAAIGGGAFMMGTMTGVGSAWVHDLEAIVTFAGTGFRQLQLVKIASFKRGYAMLRDKASDQPDAVPDLKYSTHIPWLDRAILATKSDKSQDPAGAAEWSRDTAYSSYLRGISYIVTSTATLNTAVQDSLGGHLGLGVANGLFAAGVAALLPVYYRKYTVSHLLFPAGFQEDSTAEPFDPKIMAGEPSQTLTSARSLLYEKGLVFIGKGGGLYFFAGGSVMGGLYGYYWGHAIPWTAAAITGDIRGLGNTLQWVGNVYDNIVYRVERNEAKARENDPSLPKRLVSRLDSSTYAMTDEFGTILGAVGILGSNTVGLLALMHKGLNGALNIVELGGGHHGGA